MGKVFMWLGIVLGGVLVVLFFVSTIMPQNMADFFMGFGAANFNIEQDGEMHRVAFDTLGDGVEPDDRLFLMKKMIAFHVLADYEAEFEDEKDEFNRSLLEAAEDNVLSSAEVLDLKKMHEDILPEERVNDWIDMAKELEELKTEKEMETEEQ